MICHSFAETLYSGKDQSCFKYLQANCGALHHKTQCHLCVSIYNVNLYYYYELCVLYVLFVQPLIELFIFTLLNCVSSMCYLCNLLCPLIELFIFMFLLLTLLNCLSSMCVSLLLNSLSLSYSLSIHSNSLDSLAPCIYTSSNSHDIIHISTIM